jgi:hypothetical protein
MNDSPQDLWIIKWGLLGLKTRDSEIKPRDRPDIASIIKLFKSCRYISNVKFNEELRQNMGLAFYRKDGLITLLRPLYLSIKISKKDMKLTSIYLHLFQTKLIDERTEFNVIYNGYIYIIYWKVNSAEDRLVEGADIRIILETCIESSKFSNHI